MQGGYAGNAAGMKISSLHKLTDIRYWVAAFFTTVSAIFTRVVAILSQQSIGHLKWPGNFYKSNIFIVDYTLVSTK